MLSITLIVNLSISQLLDLTASFDSIYDSTFDSLDVWMYTKGKIKIEVQIKFDTSGGSDLTWQEK